MTITALYVSLLLLPVHPDDLDHMPDAGTAMNSAAAALAHLEWFKGSPFADDHGWQWDARRRCHLWRMLVECHALRRSTSAQLGQLECSLEQLRFCLGAFDYYRASMPDPVPLERFADCEPGEHVKKRIIAIYR